MKILFITTHNLATNPRLLKEVKLSVAYGYQVELICFVFRNWSYELNENVVSDLKNRGVIFHCIEAGKENIKPWLISIIKEKSNRLLSALMSLPNPRLANAVSRRNHLLIQSLKKIRKADWVIGHNPGALWATLEGARLLNCKLGFDVEDYHPGEGGSKNERKNIKKLMQAILPKMNYVSFASPLIKQAVEKDVRTERNNWITILNYFPASEFINPSSIDGRLKLVWFSQNINLGRGLELVLPFIKNYASEVELHLFGYPVPSFINQYFTGLNNVFFHGTVSQSRLHEQLSNFDIGLALDLPIEENRDIALTNKILSYFQAGLYIVACNTSAQKYFLDTYPNHGKCFDYIGKDIIEVLKYLLSEKDLIRSKKNERFEFAQNHGWENESHYLLKLWSE